MNTNGNPSMALGDPPMRTIHAQHLQPGMTILVPTGRGRYIRISVGHVDTKSCMHHVHVNRNACYDAGERLTVET